MGDSGQLTWRTNFHMPMSRVSTWHHFNPGKLKVSEF